MFVAYWAAVDKPFVCALSYSMSQLLDMFDGKMARMLNQATKFGAMLDMLTDRCSGIGLMLILAQIHPRYTIAWHFFIWLDIFSHWCHMLAQLRSGSASHKTVKGGPRLLQYYYSTNWFMVILIIGAEGFPLSFYGLGFPGGIWIFTEPVLEFLRIVFFPLFITKHLINVLQFMEAARKLDEIAKD